ncbi:MAG: EpsI family protein, partial [Desulfobulbaceae bacterium S5133MH15]
GYYLSTRKVGAAHSPLVCFPGQGWIISSKDRTALKIKGNEIHLLSMIVTRGQEKELVAYWFQSYDQTDPDTLSQKISLLWQKLLHEKENNAFVRVSISVGEKSLSEARDTVFEFIRSFYPVFLNYVKDNKP